MLLERHGLAVSRETLRKWMVEDGLWLSRKQRRQFHQPRLRREHFGELVQIDGSEHHWFEGRGRRAVEAAPAPRVLGETEGMSINGRISVERIVIELEIPGDSRSLFRLWLDKKVVGENLTAVQTHLLVGEILDRITLPRPAERE
jgi:hypothetical protein